MTDFVVRVLDYGVLGLCAVTLLMVWRVLQSEQKREGDPRKGILKFVYVFMCFCLSLALVNGYVQLREGEVPSDVTAEMKILRNELRVVQDHLLTIQSAAGPIINARSNILGRLQDGPEKDALTDLLGALKETLVEP